MIVSSTIDFELGARIGAAEGRNSEVFRAFDLQLDADVVVKKMAKTSFSDVNEYFSEAKKLYDARHQNVADVRYACSDADHIYLVMPLYAGGSLHSLAAASALTNRQVIRFGLDLLHGLHHVHGRRLVHFDVKPSNVLIDHTGKAALADFGISKYLSASGLALVDRLYFLHLPPEYLISQELTQAADIYQAGLTLYRVLVGIETLEEQAVGRTDLELEAAIQGGLFPDRALFPLHVPASLVKVVRTALSVDPDKRYPTALDMIAALAAVNQHLDWLYSATPDLSNRNWEILKAVQKKQVSLDRAGTKWNVTSVRTNVSTGVIRRDNALSAAGLEWGEARALVIKALRELE